MASELESAFAALRAVLLAEVGTTDPELLQSTLAEWRERLRACNAHDDLLSACRAVLVEANMSLEEGDRDSFAEISQSALRKVTAAIAKAEKV